MLATQLMGQNQFASVSTVRWLTVLCVVWQGWDSVPGSNQVANCLIALSLSHGSALVNMTSLIQLACTCSLTQLALLCHLFKLLPCCCCIAGRLGAHGCGCCCCWRQAGAGVSAALLPAPCDGHRRD
jgi:hypothetical protein